MFFKIDILNKNDIKKWQLTILEKSKENDRIKEFFSDLVQVVRPIGLPEVCIHKNAVYERN